MIYLEPNKAEASTYSFFFLRNSALKALTSLRDARLCPFFLTWNADVMAGATVMTLPP